MRHVIVSSVAPSTAPEQVGQHYVNTVTGRVYHAKGTASALDWVDVTSVAVINTQTASYVLALADGNSTIVELNVATANTLTVPPNSAAPFDIGTTIPVSAIGAGQTTITAGAGVTIRSAGGALKLRVQYSGASLYKRAADEWVLTGDLSV